MYSEEQRNKALKLYDECQSVVKVIRILGYPQTRQGLYNWIKQRNQAPKDTAARKRVNNSPEHPFHPSVKTKLSILRRCFIEGENVQLVSEETGYSLFSIYIWRRNYQLKGALALMNPQDDPRGVLNEGNPSSVADIESLKQQLQDMQLEIDILKETIDVLKKDPGVNMESLKNRENAVIVDALKNRYPLSLLLMKLHFAKSAIIIRRTALIALINMQIYATRLLLFFMKIKNVTVTEEFTVCFNDTASQFLKKWCAVLCSKRIYRLR